MNLTLQELTHAQSAAYLETLWPRYRDELILAGSSGSEADANIERNRQGLMPGGVVAPGQFMFRVMQNENQVGNLWLSKKDDAGSWFIYDIEILEAYRGRGFGRAAMQLAEDYAHSRGATNLGLSVFGFNTIARSMYESLGYNIVAMQMTKNLD